MGLPTAIRRLFSFTGFQQAQGDDSFPGTFLDADLDQLANTVDALISVLAGFVRSDGKLANGSVGLNALAADVRLGLGASRPWDGAVSYVSGETVTRGYGLYQALSANAGTDPTGNPGTWALVADLSQAVVVAANAIGTSAIQDAAVTLAKMATDSVDGRVLAPGAVSRENAAANLGVVPVGAEVDFAGPGQPAGWLLCAGQAVSRTTYADLFAALTTTVTADLTTGSTALTNVARTIAGFGFRGARVEGDGIPAGTILTADTDGGVTLSNAVTAGGSGKTVRIAPHGLGNGATTFNLPDRRGRVTIGRDDMTGAGAGRFQRAFDGSNLAGVGGQDGEILVIQHLPVAMPGGTVTVGYPPQTYTRNLDLSNASGAGAAGTTPVPDLWHGYASATTVAPGPQDFSFGITNAGGGQPHSTVQPTGVANRIIFAGA